MIYKYTFNTPIGSLTAYEFEDTLIRLSMKDDLDGEYRKIPLLMQTQIQLEQYFRGKRTLFELPINLSGTEYQMKIWKLLCDIPYGETVSYSDIAQKSGNIRAARAVGGAVNKNPLMIIIPCHRVVRKNGRLVGYEYGVGIKQQLLDLEKQTMNKIRKTVIDNDL